MLRLVLLSLAKTAVIHVFFESKPRPMLVSLTSATKAQPGAAAAMTPCTTFVAA